MIFIGGSTGDWRAANRHLKRAAELHNLVSPAPQCGVLPAGFEVAITLIRIGSQKPELYQADEEGLWTLGVTPLRRIANAAGVDWVPGQSGRLRGPTHPHYVRYRSVARVQSFDCSWRRLVGEVEIDVREGSPQLEALRQSQNFTEQHLAKIRAHVLQHAETRSKARAIADLGIKRAYTLSEVMLGFAVARLIWTGRSRSKALRHAFALQQSAARFAGETALFGEKDGAG